MTFPREGLAAIALTGTVAAAVIATSVWRRSWPLWLLGYVMMLVTAWVALTFRAAPAAPSAVIPAPESAASPDASRPIDVVAASMSTRHSR